MLEAKITIESMELAAAINSLATAISGAKLPQQAVPQQALPQQALPQPALPQQAVPQQALPQQALPQPALPQQAEAVQAPAPTATSVPLAQPPQYTHDQIMTAGAALMDAGKASDLINLLHTYGVQAVVDLKQEQLGEFATAMRNLGAKL